MKFSTVLTLKIVIVALALITTILGCVSHFQSSWTKSVCINNGAFCMASLYKICDAPGAEECPDIAMERYFVSMAIICCILSTMFLVIDLMGNEKKKYMKILDAVYHIITAVLLVIAAILYIVSTEQIQNIVVVNKDEDWGIDFKRPEKLASATLMLIQGLLCGVTAHLFLNVNKF